MKDDISKKNSKEVTKNSASKNSIKVSNNKVKKTNNKSIEKQKNTKKSNKSKKNINPPKKSKSNIDSVEKNIAINKKNIDKVCIFNNKVNINIISILLNIILILIIVVVFFSNSSFLRYKNQNYLLLGRINNIKNNNFKLIQKDEKVLDDNYLFLGDSITDFYDLEKYYPNMPVVNSGINGDSAQNILNDMNGRIYKYNPSKVFILIGTNQIQYESEEEVFDSIIEIVEGIRKNRKYTEIYVESIYPVNQAVDKNMVKGRDNSKIKKLNKLIKSYCINKVKVTYVDMYSKLEDEYGKLKEEYTKDGLHLSEKGYDVVTKTIKKYL